MVPQQLDLVTSNPSSVEGGQILPFLVSFFCRKEIGCDDFQGRDVFAFGKKWVRFPRPADTVSTSSTGTTLTSMQKTCCSCDFKAESYSSSGKKSRPSNMVNFVDLVTSNLSSVEESQWVILPLTSDFCRKEIGYVTPLRLRRIRLWKKYGRFPLPADTVTSTSSAGTTCSLLDYVATLKPKAIRRSKEIANNMVPQLPLTLSPESVFVEGASR
jgi:hypothetical protein